LFFFFPSCLIVKPYVYSNYPILQ
jgi:hypothetical protein